MRSSQVFAAVTVALGAIFLGTCIYFREDLGIPTEVFTGSKGAPEETGPRCAAVAMQTNATASVTFFNCRNFEDASKEVATEQTRRLVQLDQYGLNFTIETINPSIRETCAEYGTDIEICDQVDQVGAAGFIVWNTQERYTHRGVDYVRFYFTDNKSNTRKEALLEFRYWRSTVIDECARGRKAAKACTLVREDVIRGFVIERVWRITRFNFQLILTITDSPYS